MASLVPKLLLLLSTMVLCRSCFALQNHSSSTPNTTDLDSLLSSIRSICKTTPHPEACFDSLKLSISINISPDILTYVLQILGTAISEAGKVSGLLSTAGSHRNIVEKQIGAIQDCKDLHQITVSSLQKSVSRVKSADSRKITDARTYLSAALTNKNTCLEGLDSASGPLKQPLVNSLTSTYKQVSNSLSMLPKQRAPKGHKNRRLLGFPTWMSRKARRILQSSGNEYDPIEVLTVAADGTGNFTTITEAVNFAPNNSYDRTIIHIKQGVYEENVEIPSNKANIVLLGAGSDVTIITGNRSVASGWTTFRSATLGNQTVSTKKLSFRHFIKHLL